MVMGMLVNKYPELMGIMKRYLRAVVAECERRYKADPGTYWYRFFRPTDDEIGGTAKKYYGTFTNATAEYLLANNGAGAAFNVPTANAYVSFGWYCDCDLGYGGYFLVEKQDVVKHELLAQTVYNMENPKHLYLDFDSVIVGFQQEKLAFKTMNNFGADQKGLIFPFLFRVATKSALNLQ